MARLSRRISSSSNLPTRARTLVLEAVVSLSTIRRQATRKPLRSFGSTGKRNRGGFGLVRGEGADRDRVGCVEAIILNDDDRAWLDGVVLAAGHGSDIATLHSSPQSDTASMNA